MSVPGVVLAVDVGTVRVGVAASDPHRVLASPVETVAAPGHRRVAQLVAEREAVLLVMALPPSLVPPLRSSGMRASTALWCCGCGHPRRVRRAMS